MNDTSANPIFVALLFILRCIIPLAVLFGISYLLRKMGLVAVESPEPPDDRAENGEGGGGGTSRPEPSEADSNRKPNAETPRSPSK